MIKFIYVVFLAITSLVLFIFSKEKDATTCTHEATGIIQSISDSGYHHLVIVSDQNTIYAPQSMHADVVLAAGKKVSICYSADSSVIRSSNNVTPVNIHSVTYLK